MKPQVPFPVRLTPPLVVSSNNTTAGGEPNCPGKEIVFAPAEQADVPASRLATFWLTWSIYKLLGARSPRRSRKAAVGVRPFAPGLVTCGAIHVLTTPSGFRMAPVPLLEKLPSQHS